MKFIIICVSLPYVGESYGGECDEISQKGVEESSQGSHRGESVLCPTQLSFFVISTFA